MDCKHCGRTIVQDKDGRWIDPEATGDDGVWRETCDSHDTFTAEHEPSSTDRIYFDPEDEATDGLGWNVVEDDEDGTMVGAIALRFATEEEAKSYVEGSRAAENPEEDPDPTQEDESVDPERRRVVD